MLVVRIVFFFFFNHIYCMHGDCVQGPGDRTVNESQPLLLEIYRWGTHKNTVLSREIGEGKQGALWAGRKATGPTSGSQGGFSLCCSLILKPPVVSVIVRINTVLKGTRAGPACLPFCAPATTASLSQPAIQAHPRGLCSHQCPAGGSSPDTCMLDALMPLRCGSSITSSPVCPHKTTPSFPALLLLFLRRTHMPHILFVYLFILHHNVCS